MSERVNATALKPFVGAKNFQVSKAFYLDMGFAINWESSNLIQFEFTGCQFYLQDFYEPTWCDNTMLYLEVDDVFGIYRRIKAVSQNPQYEGARCQPPEPQPYGALVAYLWDPSGVLWHIAEMSAELTE